MLFHLVWVYKRVDVGVVVVVVDVGVVVVDVVLVVDVGVVVVVDKCTSSSRRASARAL